MTNSLKRSVSRRFSRARKSRQKCANEAILAFTRCSIEFLLDLILIPGQFNNKASVRQNLVNIPIVMAFYSLFPFIHD